MGISTQTNAAGKLQVIVLSSGSITDTFLTNTFDKTADRPDRFALDLPASLALPTSLGVGPLAVSDTDVKSVRWGTVHTDGKAYTRIVLDLNAAQQYHVTAATAPDGNGMLYTIEPGAGVTVTPPTGTEAIATPEVISPTTPHGNGSIRGMLIVVDPGHGGKDTGAPGADGLYEKNLTLAIGKDLRDALVDAGAKVLMTREDDTFIPLPTRSQLAIDNQADYFISVHCDSGNSRNAQEVELSTIMAITWHVKPWPCALRRGLARQTSESNQTVSERIMSGSPDLDFPCCAGPANPPCCASVDMSTTTTTQKLSLTRQSKSRLPQVSWPVSRILSATR